MKKILLLFSIIWMATSAFANQPLYRDTVISVPDKSASQIYDGLKKWFITNAKFDSRYIIEQDDKENKHMVGKFSFPHRVNSLTWGGGSGYITVVIDVMARDGRFKLVLSDFNHKSDYTSNEAYWSLGTITEEIPEEWATGLKKIHKRETYKRVRPHCDEIVNTIFSAVAEYCKEFKPIEEDDW